MQSMKKINSALISVYHKDRLDEIVKLLVENDITIYSTGGTYDFIKSLGIETKTVEALTLYPSILGGRVKTLHPKVFGGSWQDVITKKIFNRWPNTTSLKSIL